MPGWTKEQYDTAYSWRVERYLGGHPNTRLQVRLHYHEHFMRPIMVERWKGILPVITPSITSNDRVLIVGAGFGWGVRALKNRIGCDAIGIDTSPYIQNVKNTDDKTEIEAKITAVGLDPSLGRGLEILNFCRTTGNRAKEIVLDEDMASPESRQRIGTELGGSPTWIITEDLVTDEMSDLDIISMSDHFNQSTANKVWLYTPSPTRTSEQLNTLTGHKVIEFGTFRIVG